MALFRHVLLCGLFMWFKSGSRLTFNCVLFTYWMETHPHVLVIKRYLHFRHIYLVFQRQCYPNCHLKQFLLYYQSCHRGKFLLFYQHGHWGHFVLFYQNCHFNPWIIKVETRLQVPTCQFLYFIKKFYYAFIEYKFYSVYKWFFLYDKSILYIIVQVRSEFKSNCVQIVTCTSTLCTNYNFCTNYNLYIVQSQNTNKNVSNFFAHVIIFNKLVHNIHILVCIQTIV